MGRAGETLLTFQDRGVGGAVALRSKGRLRRGPSELLVQGEL